MKYTIYCHANRVNGKMYVGQTYLTIGQRWRMHVSNAKTSKPHCKALANAILEYGPEVFDHEVLDVVTTEDGADIAERVWIEHFNCVAPNGYNLKPGGRRARHNPDTARRIGEASRARIAKLTPEQKVERAHKARVGMAKVWADMTPEQRRRRVARMNAGKRPRSQEARDKQAKRARDWWAALSPREKNEKAAVMRAGVTPERLQEISRKGVEAWAALPKEERDAIMAERRAARAAKKRNGD
jgi:group I intron endonuclease